MRGGWLLHREKGQNLKQVVLHDVPNNAKLVKVSTATIRAERLFERD